MSQWKKMLCCMLICMMGREFASMESLCQNGEKSVHLVGFCSTGLLLFVIWKQERVKFRSMLLIWGACNKHNIAFPLIFGTIDSSRNARKNIVYRQTWLPFNDFPSKPGFALFLATEKGLSASKTGHLCSISSDGQ